MKLIEIGVNLTDPVFRGVYRGKQAHPDDLDQVLERARKVGVHKMIVTGGSLSESREALELASRYDSLLYATVGCHPTRCLEFTQGNDPEGYYNQLLSLARSHEYQGRVVAIGECGLDYDRIQFCPKKVQLEYFIKQLDLAETTGLPMFLHNRNTGNDFIDIMRQHRHRIRGGVVHSFTGSLEEALALVDLDLYIGINGCSLKTEENLRVVKAIPCHKLMIETDAPWCDIRPTHASFPYLKQARSSSSSNFVYHTFESKKKERFVPGSLVKGRNEPCNIQDVLLVMAAVRETSPTDLALTLYENTCRLFFPTEAAKVQRF
ncbi:hypothetical protein IWQ61_005666 [Dispira simplex]|nr:hypothetical protein IWQ61_005666 [Dispira simplex]